MLLRMQEQQGITPEALLNRPELTEFQTWLVSEFGRLSKDRRYTDTGPLPLHTGAILTYYNAFKMHGICFEDFYDRMTAIDDIWLERVSERSKKEQALAESKSKNSRKRRN